jgi:hypothetical protein
MRLLRLLASDDLARALAFALLLVTVAETLARWWLG